MKGQPKYLEERYDNKYYQKFNKEKQKIKEKYPAELFEIPREYKNHYYPMEHRRLYREYLKEIGDLMYQKEGWYQKFIWDTLSDSDKAEFERKLKSLNKEKFHYY